MGDKREERVDKEGRVGLEQPVSMKGHGVPRDRMISISNNQQLYVGNLPKDCTEEQLEDLFAKFGKVIDVRINQKRRNSIVSPRFIWLNPK